MNGRTIVWSRDQSIKPNLAQRTSYHTPNQLLPQSVKKKHEIVTSIKKTKHHAHDLAQPNVATTLHAAHSPSHRAAISLVLRCPHLPLAFVIAPSRVQLGPSCHDANKTGENANIWYQHSSGELFFQHERSQVAYSFWPWTSYIHCTPYDPKKQRQLHISWSKIILYISWTYGLILTSKYSDSLAPLQPKAP